MLSEVGTAPSPRRYRTPSTPRPRLPPQASSSAAGPAAALKDRIGGALSRATSKFSWQRTQVVASGIAWSRLEAISSPQTAQVP